MGVRMKRTYVDVIGEYYTTLTEERRTMENKTEVGHAVKCIDCKIEWNKKTKNARNRCPLCRRIWERNWRLRRKESGNPVISTKMPRSYHREYEKIYYSNPEVKMKINARMRKYQKDPVLRIRQYARAAVKRAIMYGRIIKLKNCSDCRKETKLQAHHEDYLKPLKIIWLCLPCHRLKHAKAQPTT